jgi:hypothetical protein
MDIKSYLLELHRGVSERYFEFSDTVGPVLESGPFKYFGNGYWVEKYARKSLEEIRSFEEKLRNPIQGDLLPEELEPVYEKLRWNDRKSLLYGVGAAMIPFGLAIISPLYLAETNGDLYSLLMIPSTFLAHEYACPSSLRKYRSLFLNGEKELADIVTPWRSGNRSMVYLFTIHPELWDYTSIPEKERSELQKRFEKIMRHRNW